MTDAQVLILLAIFGAATIATVLAQNLAPEKFRPFTIIKGVVRSSLDSRRRKKEYKRKWKARPCHNCGWQGKFYNTHHKEHTSTGVVIIQLFIILFIITPLTFGLGLLLIPFMLIFNGSTTPVQQCPNCGAERPR